MGKQLTGTWTRWRRTNEWAVRVDGEVQPGAEIRVQRRDETTSEVIVGETLWSGDGRSIVRVALEADAEPVRMIGDIEILATHGARDLSVYWRLDGDAVWQRCPPNFHDFTQALDYARIVRVPPGAKVRIVEHAWDHERRDRMVTRLKGYELRRRGLVRAGALDLRAADDEELDRMWGAKSRVSRARVPDREPPDETVDVPRSRVLRSLKLEFVGHDLWSILKVKGMRPWVARVSFGEDGEVSDRDFADATTDYADADKTGCRGVMSCYLLPQGVPYEVFDRARELGPRRVFMLHDGIRWLEITKECARRCAG